MTELMTDLPTLEEVDSDGAIREAADRVRGDSRAGFLGKALLATGGLVGGGAVLGALARPAAAQTANDVAILNFALTLEYLEAAFYTEATSMGALAGRDTLTRRTLRFAQTVGAHERAHVAFLQRALGSAAVARPQFNFRGTTENKELFVKTAIVLEDTGVKAYKGQAPLIDTPAVLIAAAKIHSVEARHAAWVRHIAGQPPAPAAFDMAATKSQILAAVAGTRFIVGAGGTSGGGSPRFTG
ncbi:MAG: ferritin-like domain-containing protein [Actinobacteria bacterium]|nr:ferritin-like domain-containing protein [Actinomycetota bacterium]